jgi:hypothetical protein
MAQSLAQMIEETKFVRNTLQRMEQDSNAKGRNNLGGTDTLPTQVKAAMSSEFSNLQKNIARDLERVLGNDEGEVTASASSAGLSWMSTLMVYILTLELAMIFLLQMKIPKENSLSKRGGFL